MFDKLFRKLRFKVHQMGEMMKKTRKVRWDPIVARLTDSNLKQVKIISAPKKNKSSDSEWNPIIARLADNNLKQSTMVNEYQDNRTLRIKDNWATNIEKKRTREEFTAYIHELFAIDSPKVKYQNPDSWNVFLTKKKSRNH